MCRTLKGVFGCRCVQSLWPRALWKFQYKDLDQASKYCLNVPVTKLPIGSCTKPNRKSETPCGVHDILHCFSERWGMFELLKLQLASSVENFS
jgi:hypothetical protein